ncbi:hypothetical protein [Paenibacillus mucilaginosus]|uniref:Uncharacterized protein n=3 Tax=Paenibacillus mucilaginosus TaxID=61624 RepID=H6NBK4_9BACL|nr:hypothetical protein [Paenibacillus mucilaginosus]AEI46153.1 hypothetical protein KNP414_07667 [Paenibacillus mucilaginosus KNP414]AFC33773.1 hypothetical protein PM3016_7197 [Paenibacillus mucilaginosus 3016]AFH66104.1 hypothetical protein B2K_36305 [Paenibacillus mucilaginosus K02]MCG7213713.1 hypothetical protein [Paenibacillus mucilaginosus]WDM27483.1 hypothetical protein KCX80_34925 [Paenibacillus mucilaginosus]
MNALRNRISHGWSIAWKQPFAVIALFVYHLAWGVLLYKLIQSVVLPLLHRYPGEVLPREAVQLFWIEGQFQLMKTDLLQPYLWWALGLLALRAVLHPVLNAGVLYSLHNRDLNAGYRFVEGVRRLSVPFFSLYVLQLLMTLAPLYWLLPYAAGQYIKHSSYLSYGKALLLPLGIFILWVFLLQLLFLFLQIAKTAGRSSLYALIFVARHLPAILAAGAAVAVVSLLVSAAVMASSYLWAGFLALLGYQAYRLLQMFFKVWAIGTQYALWIEKA